MNRTDIYYYTVDSISAQLTIVYFISVIIVCIFRIPRNLRYGNEKSRLVAASEPV